MIRIELRERPLEISSTAFLLSMRLMRLKRFKRSMRLKRLKRSMRLIKSHEMAGVGVISF